MIEALDSAGTGQIQMERYLELMGSKLKPSSNMDQVKNAFKVFDVKKNGIISTEEFEHAVKTFSGDTMSADEITQMISEADPKKNGTIDYERFLALLTSK